MRSAKLLIGGAVALAAVGGARAARSLAARRPDEVRELRGELRRELERLANADIKASRTRREPTTPPG
jgi:hypothetical protein